MGFAGLQAPRVRRQCELAFGQGVSLAIHAACNQDVDWIGTDFNAGHYRCARALVGRSGLPNLRLFDQSFAEFCARPDLGQLDAVTLTGTWSWLPEHDQKTITELILNRVVDGGVFSLDHATLPGQAATTGLNLMLRTFADELAPAAELTARIPAAVSRLKGFLDINPAFAGLHWNLRPVAEDLLTGNVSHVAHEYFNRAWRPLHFRDLAAVMATAGLAWACPAATLDGIDALHLTPRQAAFLNEIADRDTREQLRDFVLNTGRRSDVWLKGKHTPHHARGDLLAETRVILARPVERFNYEIQGSLGCVALARPCYGELLDQLSELRPRSIAALSRCLSPRLSTDEVCEAIGVLHALQMIEIVNPSDGEIDRSGPTAGALNQTILGMSLDGDDVNHLGSPLTGSGVKASRPHRLFLLARQEGAMTIDAMCKFAAAALARRPETRVDDTLIRRQAEAFERQDLNIYRALLIAT